MKLRRHWILILPLLVSIGCNAEPELHPVKGKVTLGGKSYERLIVYFRPIDQPIDKFRLGVGETDAEGNLALRSTAGNGLAEGNYRVSFSCMQVKKTGQLVGMGGDKVDDDPRAQVVELVPEEYADPLNSPVEQEVVAGQETVFVFDIPTK